ncbi:type II secretion system secretin GspD [Allosphingosinicella vermicomposti]|uniref:type II secretion system secretin GspD n=1 Tax=Allosphingosinicella vermicomposti TaxID=614671 RepID=UPI000D0EC734|nr:type II secretion system secretin GspD [Allosphingosinicella vermicomposti]
MKFDHTLIRLSVCASLLSSSALAQTADKAPAKQSASMKYDTRNGYNLAFVEADVRRVVDAVLGSMLSLDYNVDPSIQGNITLRTSQPVSKDSLIPLLESALGSVNAVLIAQGSSYRVVPREAARSRASFSLGGESSSPAAPGYATEVVSLKYGSAREIGRLLEQFLGKEIVAGTNNPMNQVLVSGTGEERAAARDLIQKFDVDTMADMNFELYRLENVDADTLLAELEKVFAPPFDIIGSRVRVVPLGRLRSVLVIARDRGDFARVEPWIKRLDAGGSGKRKLYSYSIQNGRARDIATSLQLVMGGSGSGDGPLSTPTPLVDNSLSAEGGAVSVEPEDAIGAPTRLPGSSTPLVSGGNGPRIVPNDHNNSLLIYANGEEYEFIREALDRLDQPVPQVLIEATLAEVTLTNDFRFGVNFRAFGGNDSVTNSGTSSGTPAAIFPGYSVSLIGSSAQAVLNTLQSRTNVRVLSAPKLMVLNNQTATLQVGDQVPIVTQQAQSVASPGAPIVNTIELRDTGVILKVTPRVNDSGTITLDIAQEVSDVAATTTSGINSPTIQQRRIASTVSTRTGQMVALGGLIRDRTTASKSGLPFFSQLPVVGGLFGTQRDEGSRTELIILLTPTLIRSPDEVRSIVDTLINGLDEVQPLIAQGQSGQASDAAAPN